MLDNVKRISLHIIYLLKYPLLKHYDTVFWELFVVPRCKRIARKRHEAATL